MRIAIIGGIGSGKSEVLRAARQMGFACLSADEINAEMLLSPKYIADIANAFPTAVKDGVVDKRVLADIVFSDENKRDVLNSIAHPRILDRIKNSKENPLVVEMPLLVEIGAQNLFDEIVFVRTPVELRLDRLEKRGMTADEAKKRIAAQASEEELQSVATHVIDNDGTPEDLCNRVKTVLEEILRLC